MKEAILLSLAQRLEEIGSRGVARRLIIVISDLAGLRHGEREAGLHSAAAKKPNQVGECV